MCVVSLFVENCIQFMDDFQSDIFFDLLGFLVWIPACAGMTEKGNGRDERGVIPA
jgi:hypothetical protein